MVDARTLSGARPFPVVTTGQVLGIGFLPGSRLLVVGGPRASSRSSTPTAAGPAAAARPAASIYTPGISADGRLIATAATTTRSGSGPCPTGGRSGAAASSGLVSDVPLSPDGRRLAVTAYADREPSRSVDVPTRRRRTLAPGTGTVRDFLRFSPTELRRGRAAGGWPGVVDQDLEAGHAVTGPPDA